MKINTPPETICWVFAVEHGSVSSEYMVLSFIQDESWMAATVQSENTIALSHYILDIFFQHTLVTLS